MNRPEICSHQVIAKVIAKNVSSALPLLYVLPALAEPLPGRIASPSAAEISSQNPQPTILPTAEATATTVTTEGTTHHIEGGIRSQHNLFHEFDAFSLPGGETANFHTTPDVNAVFSRVAGGSASHIDGTLQVSGSSADLYLINPAGILFGADAQLNLSGSFTATTADRLGFDGSINPAELSPLQHQTQWLDTGTPNSYDSFSSAPTAYQFNTDSPTTLTNEGTLTVGTQQSIQFISDRIVNHGTLRAPGGQITATAVPAGSTLQLNSNNLLSLEIDADSAARLDPGASPAALPTLLTGKSSANAAPAQALTIDEAGTAVLTGALDVTASESNLTGGDIALLGTNLHVQDSAILNASGPAGGGRIYVGGDYQGQGTTPTATHLSFYGAATADALVDGDGGTVVLWSEANTTFAGDISAQGTGTGQGGLVETSGRSQLQLGEDASVLTSSPSGTLGNWLLDPTVLNVVNGTGTATIIGGTNQPTNASDIDAGTIASALNGTNITLQASDRINILSDIDASANPFAGNLTLQAPSLNLDAPILLSGGSQLQGTASTVTVSPNGRVQNAVDAVAVGGVVELSTGLYQDSEILIDRDLTLTGDGIGQSVLDGQDLHRVLSISNSDVTLENLTIQNGQATSGAGVFITGNSNVNISSLAFLNHRVSNLPGDRRGAALLLDDNGTLSIHNSEFRNNQANTGGAIALFDNTNTLIENTVFDANISQGNAGAVDLRAPSSGLLTIRDSLFTNNQAVNYGGAISLGSGDQVIIQNSQFSQNFSLTGRGGAVNTYFTPLIVENSLFNANEARSANDMGGGAIAASADLNVSNSIFTNNIAYQGGAVSLSGGPLSTILDTAFSQNNSIQAGGAIALSGASSLHIENNTFSSNQAGTIGGAIATSGSPDLTLSINNSTLSGNTAMAQGGAIATLSDGSLSLSSSTIVNNFAATVGGGLSLSPSSSHTISYSLIAQNNATIRPDIAGTFTSGGYNLVQNRGDSTGYSIFDLPNGTTPLLGPLTDNGGPTLTHALLSGSPGIDGTNLVGGFDQRSAPVSGTRDIGAYERLDVAQLVHVSGTGQSTVVDTTFSAPLVIQALDALGGTVDGADITLSATSFQGADATFSVANPVQTDAFGEISTAVFASTQSGRVNIHADTPGASRLTTQFNNLADTPVEIVPDTGNNQQTTVDTAFAQRLGFLVRDRFGNPVTNVPVTFSTPTAGPSGFLSANSDITGPSGTGHVNVLANTVAGAFSVVAQSGVLSAAINLENTPDVPAVIALTSGAEQSTPVETLFPQPLSVSISDRFGNPTPGETVSLLLPSSGASAIPDSATATTDSLGQATFQLLANDTAGSYTATATTASLGALFNLTNRAVIPLPSESGTPAGQTPPIITPNNPLDPFNPALALPTDDSDDASSRIQFFDEQAFQQLERSLTEEYARYWQRPLEEDTSFQEVQQILKQAEDQYGSSAAVVYALFVPAEIDESAVDSRYTSALSRRLLNRHVQSDDDQLMLLMVPAAGPPVQQLVDTSRAQVERHAQLLNIELSSFLSDTYIPLAQSLYSWLLAPIEDDLQAAGIEDVMYVLDAGLGTVPIAAMMHDETYAIERYNLSMLPSVGLLTTNFEEQPAETTVLAGGIEHFQELEPLPAVPVELDTIQASSSASQILLNEELKLEALLSAQAVQPRNIIHIATHAAFNAGRLDNSYIQLWDEQLGLEDISELDLSNLEMLILSACATATGSREAELGFAGLAANTGVEASIGSLWNVSDLGTMTLMAEFYQQLQTQPLRAQALRETQLAMLRQEARIENNQLIYSGDRIHIPAALGESAPTDFSHPFYWSGFTLVGNPWW